MTTSTTFWLGVHEPSWLGTAGVPLFLSRRRLAARTRLPRAIADWALDSGGFSELSLLGCWSVAPAQYVAEVRRWADAVGRLTWAAVQDWMCEPPILAKTGKTVRQHQALTVQSYLDLRSLAPDLPWVPVLQGWTTDDYVDHLAQYDRAGVDLRALPLVGLGSVCRRQRTAGVEALIGQLTALGLTLHGFGFKLKGLERVAGVLASADSMAWSFDARRAQRPLVDGCTHANCANCLRYALVWRRRVIDICDRGTGQERQAVLSF